MIPSTPSRAVNMRPRKMQCRYSEACSQVARFVKALRTTTERFRDLGFFGRSCIHPKQLPVIHDVFTPSPEEVADAREIIAAYDRGLETASGSEVTKGGQFVDIAVVKRARAVVELSEELQS